MRVMAPVGFRRSAVELKGTPVRALCMADESHPYGQNWHSKGGQLLEGLGFASVQEFAEYVRSAVGRACWGRLHDQADVDDLTEEVILALLVQLTEDDSTYTAPGGSIEERQRAFTGYVYGIVKHMLVRHWQGDVVRQRQRAAYSQSLRTKLGGSAATIDGLSQVDRKALQDAIESLPSDVQTVLILRWLRQLSWASIELLTGENREKLQVAMTRALASMQKFLRAHPEGPSAAMPPASKKVG
jgi:RNA polymerase sigma factor (sigma-70 family)